MRSIIDPGISPNPTQSPLEKLKALASELDSNKQSILLKIIAELEISSRSAQNAEIDSSPDQDTFTDESPVFPAVRENSESLLAEARLREQQQLIDAVISIAPVIFFKVN
ncbi:MAG: hypothetical protein P8074_20260, partial [Anaerolineales bacterium]